MTVPAQVIEELSRHLAQRAPVDPHELVFTAPAGAPIRRKHFRTRVWLPAVSEAGFDGLTFHGLRHSAAGLMIEIGTHPRVMQKRLGHSSIRTTINVYGSVLEHVDAQVADGLSDLLSAQTADSRGLAAASGAKVETPESTARPMIRGFGRGAEGSRTPGLLDATEAL